MKGIEEGMKDMERRRRGRERKEGISKKGGEREGEGRKGRRRMRAEKEERNSKNEKRETKDGQ